jgi:hypothetical protein
MLFSGLENAIMNRVVRPSTVVARLKECVQNYNLIEAACVPVFGFKPIVPNTFTRDVREIAITQLLDDFRVVGRKRSACSEK